MLILFLESVDLLLDNNASIAGEFTFNNESAWSIAVFKLLWHVCNDNNSLFDINEINWITIIPYVVELSHELMAAVDLLQVINPKTRDYYEIVRRFLQIFHTSLGSEFKPEQTTFSPTPLLLQPTSKSNNTAPKEFFALYRGIHFFSNKFTPNQTRDYLSKYHLHRHHSSPAASAEAYSPFIEITPSVTNSAFVRESSVAHNITKIRNFFAKLEEKRDVEQFWGKKKRIFSSLRDLVYNNYTPMTWYVAFHYCKFF